MSGNLTEEINKDVPNEQITNTKETVTADLHIQEEKRSEEFENQPVKVDHEQKSEESSEMQGSSINPETLEKLTLGFLSHCLPDLQKSKSALTEILTNQKVLQETVLNENAKFKINEDIEQTMAKTKFYHSKLLYLKREMNSLAEKSFKMRTRGIKLQQQKTVEEIKKKEQEEKEKMREEMLTAKVAKKRSNSKSDKS